MAVPAPQPALLTRSSEFYFDVPGYPVFLVEDTLYKLDPNTIFRHSAVLQDIAGVPGPGGSQQLSSDTNPIGLPEERGKEEFEKFIRVAYGNPATEDEYGQSFKFQESIIKTLELSDYLMSPALRRHCLFIIQRRHFCIPPVQLIQICYRFRTRAFYETAFHYLVAHPIRDLTIEDTQSLGFAVYVALARLKEAHAEHRAILASEEPQFAPMGPDGPSHCAGCVDNYACAEDWQRVWWNGMGRCLLDGRNPSSYSESRANVGNGHFYDMTKVVATYLAQEIVEDEGEVLD
ncbi:hypothetical protein R3P38DRAFT_3317323 [Favolaschia claudopus]|uniref:BTB domain-containing protein n=1 Tax=Favolaschia claudopus TaxID=2862362 RepID=A0AAW0BBE4_9AGAR